MSTNDCIEMGKSVGEKKLKCGNSIHHHPKKQTPEKVLAFDVFIYQLEIVPEIEVRFSPIRFVERATSNVKYH